MTQRSVDRSLGYAIFLVSALALTSRPAFAQCGDVPDHAALTNALDGAVDVGGTANVAVAYAGDAQFYGTAKDPMFLGKIGGVNVFGGGLALYNAAGALVGAIGVSGDTSCTDHIVAWKTRHALNFDNVPNGVAGGTDNIIFDIRGSNGNFASKSGFGHPECGFGEAPIATALPKTHPTGGAQ